MLQPKRTKYRKMHKGRNEGLSWSGIAVSCGESREIRVSDDARR